MSKILTGVFIGIFVGAVAYELLNRVNPKLVKKIEAKASEKMDGFLKTSGTQSYSNETV